jgi:hypothetical protein
VSRVCLLGAAGELPALEFWLSELALEVVYYPLVPTALAARSTLAAAEQVGRQQTLAFESPASVWVFAEALRQAGTRAQAARLPAHVLDTATHRAARAAGLLPVLGPPPEGACLALGAELPSDAFVAALASAESLLVPCHALAETQAWPACEVMVAHRVGVAWALGAVAVPVVASSTTVAEALRDVGCEPRAVASAPAPDIVADEVRRVLALS